jgi:hypothetical protein
MMPDRRTLTAVGGDGGCRWCGGVRLITVLRASLLLAAISPLVYLGYMAPMRRVRPACTAQTDHTSPHYRFCTTLVSRLVAGRLGSQLDSQPRRPLPREAWVQHTQLLGVLQASAAAGGSFSQHNVPQSP